MAASSIVTPFAVQRLVPARGRATVNPRVAAFSRKAITPALSSAKRVSLVSLSRRRDTTPFAAAFASHAAGAPHDDDEEDDDEGLDLSDVELMDGE